MISSILAATLCYPQQITLLFPYSLPLPTFDCLSASIQEMPRGGVAFYNCGPHSGRSQPHKHVQVVPLPLHPDGPEALPLQGVIDQAVQRAGARQYEPVEVRALPYRCYAARLSPEVEDLKDATFEEAMSQNQALNLEKALCGLLELALPGAVASASESIDPIPSYNVILTLETLLVIPRRSETYGPLAINSLGFAGTLLLRSEEDADFARSVGPAKILSEVGCPWGDAL